MSLFDDIIKGVQVGVNVGAQTGLFAPGGGSGSQSKQLHYPLKDSGEMSAVLDQIWLTQWNQAAASLPPDQLLTVANQIRSVFYDPTVFQQSGTENDAYLNNSKQSINGYIADLQAQLSPGASAITGTPTTGQTAAVNNIVVGGLTITPNMLLLGGVGVLAFGLLLSRK